MINFKGLPISLTDQLNYRPPIPDNSKTDPWSSNAGIYNQAKGQPSGMNRFLNSKYYYIYIYLFFLKVYKSIPIAVLLATPSTQSKSPGVYVNINGTRVYGHYILKSDSNATNTNKKSPNFGYGAKGYNNTNINASKWKPGNNSYPDIHPHSTSQSNPTNHYQQNNPSWKPIKHNNKTQYTVNNHFNQSHIGWKPENKTNIDLYNHKTRIPPTSTSKPVHPHEEPDDVGNYNIRNESPGTTTDAFIPSYSAPVTPPTNRQERILPDGLSEPWEKPDTNAPTVSIDEDNINYGYDDELGYENKINSVSVEPSIDRYDVDVLDIDTWKPKVVNKSKNKTTTESTSSVMKIDVKTVDLDIFNAESAPWKQSK